MKKYKKYKKGYKKPKAAVGAALAIPAIVQAGMSIYNLAKARQAEKDVDKSKLDLKESAALKELTQEPIKQSYIESLQESFGKDFATSMGQIGDDRAKVGLYNRLQAQKRDQDLKVLGLSEQARQKALAAKADFDARKGMFEAQMTAKELENIGAARGAAQQSLMNVLGDAASLYASGAFKNKTNGGGNVAGGVDTMPQPTLDIMPQPTLGTQTSIASGTTLPGNFTFNEKGGYIDSKEGGVTPGEFDHDSNPIDIVQDGEKKGEMTGGELIVPPHDVEDIRKALESGDAEQAMSLMKTLVAKYDDNVMETEDTKAQEGGTIPPLDSDRANEIVKVMKENSMQVTNLGELPYDPDPTNPAGLLNYVGSKLSFDLDSTSVAEMDFIKNYRDFLLKKEGRTDSQNK
jgi:hypothetical protein